MSTVMKVHPNSTQPTKHTPEERQLHKDRITLGIVLAVVAALIGLMVWLASISPGLESGSYYWMY